MPGLSSATNTPAKRPDDPVVFKRFCLSSTPAWRPFYNRETGSTGFLKDNSAKGNFFQKLFKEIKNDPNPFTFKAKDINKKPLKGLHTKDTAMGKIFRLFRTLLVGAGFAASLLLGVAGVFTPISPIVALPVFITCGILVPVMIDGAYAKDKFVAWRAKKAEAKAQANLVDVQLKKASVAEQTKVQFDNC